MEIYGGAMELSSGLTHMMASSSGVEGRTSKLLNGTHSNLIKVATDEGIGVMSREAADALKAVVMAPKYFESL